MTTIILIRHAPTQIDPSVSSDEWQLTGESKLLCQKLAEYIRSQNIEKIYTSHEPKAKSTGVYIAQALDDIPTQVVDNLHETERKSKRFYESQEEFREAVRVAMLSSDELLFGDETFNHACKRLSDSIDTLAKHHPDEAIAIVSHGRILAMYLSQVMPESSVEIWQKLKMPAFAVLSWETKTIEQIVYQIEDAL